MVLLWKWMNYTREVKWHGHCTKALRRHHFTLHFSFDFKYPPHEHCWFLMLLLVKALTEIFWLKWLQRWPASEETCEPVPETRPSSATRIRTEALQPFPWLCNSTDPVRKAGLLSRPNSLLNSLKNQHSFLLAQAKQNRGASITPI